MQVAPQPVAPPAAVPAYPPGAYPPGAYPAYPAGAYPPGAYPAPPPGAYAVPPGAYYVPPGGGYYAPPGMYAQPVLTERRSTGAMVGGIVGVSVGAVLLLSAGIEALVADSCASTIDLNTGSSIGGCSSGTGAVIGLSIAGLIGIGVGIPLIVWGAKRVPVGTALAPGKAFALESPLPKWVGLPGGTGWKWQF